jgi:hypothetical protein
MTETVKRFFCRLLRFVAALDKVCRKFINVNAVTKAVGAQGSQKSPELLAR